ncbi:MAG: NAD(P)H-hydrate dehydratase [Pyrinomonadaceae bacterium]|nr:NAD(P)H-hydrate dehydratase [Pyrinomonadaceae bacterium]
MQKVLTADQMRTVDRLTTERYGIPSIVLMENAAHAVARVITDKLGGSVRDRRIVFFCGPGNNGGDGAALARILWTQGANCFVSLLGTVSETKGDARINFEALKKFSDSERTNGPNENCLFLSEGSDLSGLDEIHQNDDVVVDALFGTGLSRPITGAVGNFIERVTRQRNRFKQLFVSIDIPSGLDSDKAEIIGPVFPADCTVTFTAPKAANVILPTARNNGELTVANIGSPPELIEDQTSQLFLAEQDDAARWLRNTRFTNDSYKNKRGHALVMAGSESYSGAAVLAGNAAMRSGVGLVTLAVPSTILSEVAARALPDLIVRPFEDGGEIDFAADAILIGCGLDANNTANEAMFRKIVEERTTPVIVDAGALWYLNPERGENHPVGETPPPLLGKEGSQRELILTPHEGEFLRLLGTDDKIAINDRVAAVRQYAVANNVILVLKGERVLIGAPDGRVVVNPTGNSGLGKAGNGDTLSGILAGFVAQAAGMNIDIFETVVAAVYVAGTAGDIAEKKYGKRVMTASDVRECLTEAFDGLAGN